VGENPTEELAPSGVGTEEQKQPTAEPTAEATQQKPLNLDDLPEFRKYKSARDQQLARQQREADETRRQLEATQQKLAELELQDATPSEREAYYRGKLAKLQAEQEQARQRADAERQVQAAAGELLKELGLEPDTPGLDWSGGATEEGYAKLAASAARVVAKRVREQGQQTQQQLDEATREARQAALNDAGVTRVGTSRGVAGPSPNPIEDIDDPIELLKIAFGQKGGRTRG